MIFDKVVGYVDFASISGSHSMLESIDRGIFDEANVAKAAARKPLSADSGRCYPTLLDILVNSRAERFPRTSFVPSPLNW